MCTFSNIKPVYIELNNSFSGFIFKIIEIRIPMRYLYNIFMKALFTGAKRFKQPKCPSTEEAINKYHIYKQCNITHL